MFNKKISFETEVEMRRACRLYALIFWSNLLEHAAMLRSIRERTQKKLETLLLSTSYRKTYEKMAEKDPTIKR